MLFFLILNSETSLQQVEKFRSVVEMFHHFVWGALGEFGHVCLQSLILGRESQALEEETGLDGTGTIGKLHPLFHADYGEGASPFFVAEEMVEADVENHRDAGEGWQGGYEFSIL